MIQPTIGRVMWYWPPLRARGKQPLAALVAHVVDDGTVNLGVFSEFGQVDGVQDVPIVQEPERDGLPDGHCCQWMPYQKGQAAKAEALEKQIAVAGAAPKA